MRKIAPASASLSDRVEGKAWLWRRCPGRPAVVWGSVDFGSRPYSLRPQEVALWGGGQGSGSGGFRVRPYYPTSPLRLRRWRRALADLVQDTAPRRPAQATASLPIAIPMRRWIRSTLGLHEQGGALRTGATAPGDAPHWEPHASLDAFDGIGLVLCGSLGSRLAGSLEEELRLTSA